MSNIIAHLAVASELLKKCPNFIHNERAYYLGVLAPDTIMGKPDNKREDKKKVHLREDTPDAKWLEAEFMTIFTERINKYWKDFVTRSPEEYDRWIRGTAEEAAEFEVVELISLCWHHSL